MKFPMRPIAYIVVVLGLIFVVPNPTRAENTVPAPRTITVALDGTGEFSSIQEAVDSAMKGDTVLIKGSNGSRMSLILDALKV